MSELRRPLFAGRYYPPAAAQLQTMIAAYVEDAPVAATARPLVGLIVPHAPLYEAGPVAGFAFKALMLASQSWDVAVLIAQARDCAPICCDPRDGYQLPDGQVMPLLDGWAALAGVNRQVDEDPQIEMALPFLSYALGTVPILPLRVGPGAEAQLTASQLPERSLIVVIANLADASLLRAAQELRGDRLAQHRQAPWQQLFGGRQARSTHPDRVVVQCGVALLRQAGGQHCHVLHRRGALASAVITC